MIQELAKEVGNQVVTAIVNIDQETELATEYNITTLPTLLIFRVYSRYRINLLINTADSALSQSGSQFTG